MDSTCHECHPVWGPGDKARPPLGVGGSCMGLLRAVAVTVGAPLWELRLLFPQGPEDPELRSSGIDSGGCAWPKVMPLSKGSLHLVIGQCWAPASTGTALKGHGAGSPGL